jgi:hypothetical protein
MVCPQCDAEYRPGFIRCSDCDEELVDHLRHPEGPDSGCALKGSREARVASGYFLYGIIVGGFFFMLGVVGLQAADSFGDWLWEGGPAALQPILMLIAGRMLRVRPALGRRIAFAIGIITFVSLLLVAMTPRHPPKSDIVRAFRAFIFTQSLNFPGAASFAFLLAWPDLRNAIFHTRQKFMLSGVRRNSHE